MLKSLYENAKKALLEQEDLKGVSNICTHHEYKAYFYRFTYKYYIHNPKKKDERENYIHYYREVKDKSEIDKLSIYFSSMYDSALNYVKVRELNKWHIEDLEKIIAQFEIAICKVISMCQSPLSPEFQCTKDYIIECMEFRDSMIEKIEPLRNQTVEYCRMIQD